MSKLTAEQIKAMSHEEIYKLMQDKLWLLERRLRPLRFLLVNYKAESCHSREDQEDIMAIGDLLSDHLEIVSELFNITEYAGFKDFNKSKSLPLQ